ncbi:MAPEG family protein [Bradyrhizobium sp. STM 3557]|uniref:MAPEG family protein n=1 Tax=Bradyrhizobium sp. STM 3557 TaxID=578920 RepID=UPI0038910D0E
MNIAVVCTVVLGLLLFGLGLNVSVTRKRYAKGIGHDLGADDPVHHAVRAHGNTAEYAPFLAALFLWYAARGAPVWINVTIVIATLARLLIAAGLLWGGPLNLANPLRFIGALVTYLAGLVLTVSLLAA